MSEILILVKLYCHFLPTMIQQQKERNSLEQGGNSNLDCVPRTTVVAMSDGGGGGRGVLSSNFPGQREYSPKGF